MAPKLKQPDYPASLSEGGWFLPSDYVRVRPRFRRQLLARLAHDLPAGGTILDLNAGTEGPGPELRAAGYDYLALDSNRLIRAALAERGLTVQDWRPPRLPRAEASVDLVLSLAFLEHLPTWLAAFEQLLDIRRVLRPGGRCFVIAPNAPGMGASFHDDYKHGWVTSRRRLTDMAEDAGFEVVHTWYTIGWITFIEGPASACGGLLARTAVGFSNLHLLARTLEAIGLDGFVTVLRKTLFELVVVELRKPPHPFEARGARPTARSPVRCKKA